jgi:pimeloyl-ACP methyl ester carboxylesterase
MLRYDFSKLVLIGHSGGGSLAMLLSTHLSQTQLLITLAGNYDINLWADYHGYLRLNASENPAEHANQGVTEWHFLGELDSTIPPQMFLSLLQSRSHSQVEILSGVTHQLGWVNYWPEILSRLKHD